jgi:hypothetical protein
MAGASERGYKCLAIRDFMASPVRKKKQGVLSFEKEAQAYRQVGDMFAGENITGEQFVQRIKGFGL